MATGRHRPWLIGGLVFLFLGLLAAFVCVPPALATPPHDVGPSDITVNVNTTTDVVDPSDGVCSLREALERKPGCAGDIIELEPTTYTLTDTVAGDITIATVAPMSIRVTASGQAVIQGGPGWTDRILSIISNATVDISNVTIQKGNISGTIFNNGGGIYNDGDLSIANSYILNNAAASSGGGIYNTGILRIVDSQIASNLASVGGGVANFGAGGSVWITNTIVATNIASGTILQDGGGIYTAGFVSVYSSAIVSNTAQHDGGGIIGENTQGIVILRNVTVSGNLAGSAGGGVFGGHQTDVAYATIHGNAASVGGGLEDITPATISASIVAGNAGGDCDGYWTSGGHNFIQTECDNYFPSLDDLIDLNPLLGPLQDNGGPIATLTHAPAGTSLALNQIPRGQVGCGIAITTDQRGVERPYGGACDIGAFELGAVLHRAVWLPMLQR